jgi:mitogen-activated protein kinase binding protein 1
LNILGKVHKFTSKFQSDSDQSEPVASRGGLLRPTIASSNKQNGGPKYVNPRSAAGIISRRKGMQNSYSSVNLSTTGQDESSSEESPPPNITASPAKPSGEFALKLSQ